MERGINDSKDDNHASFDQFSVHKFFGANIVLDFEVSQMCFKKKCWCLQLVMCVISFISLFSPVPDSPDFSESSSSAGSVVPEDTSSSFPGMSASFSPSKSLVKEAILPDLLLYFWTWVVLCNNTDEDDGVMQ